MSMHKGLLGQSEGGASVDQTLSDYIARKYRDDAFNQVNAEKKLTFEQWLETVDVHNANSRLYFLDTLEACWKAAQENK